MLPHGTRTGSAARPRETTAMKCTNAATTVSDTPIRPNRCIRSADGSSVSGERHRGGAASTEDAATRSRPALPAATSCRSSTRRPEAHCARWARKARKYTTAQAATAWLLSTSNWSWVTVGSPVCSAVCRLQSAHECVPPRRRGRRPSCGRGRRSRREYARPPGVRAPTSAAGG